jgi:hypothetical protein
VTEQLLNKSFRAFWRVWDRLAEAEPMSIITMAAIVSVFLPMSPFAVWVMVSYDQSRYDDFAYNHYHLALMWHYLYLSLAIALVVWIGCQIALFCIFPKQTEERQLAFRCLCITAASIWILATGLLFTGKAYRLADTILHAPQPPTYSNMDPSYPNDIPWYDPSINA